MGEFDCAPSSISRIGGYDYKLPRTFFLDAGYYLFLNLRRDAIELVKNERCSYVLWNLCQSGCNFICGQGIGGVQNSSLAPQHARDVLRGFCFPSACRAREKKCVA